MSTNTLPDDEDFDPTANTDKGAMLDHTPLKFGKYRGKTAEWISEENPGYLRWAYENVAGFPVCSDALYREIGGRGSRAKGKDAADEYERQQRERENFQKHRARTSNGFDDFDDDIPF